MTFCIVPWVLYLGVYRNVVGVDDSGDETDWVLLFTIETRNTIHAFGFMLGGD